MLIKTEYTVIFNLNTFRQQSFSILQLYMSKIHIYKSHLLYIYIYIYIYNKCLSATHPSNAISAT